MMKRAESVSVLRPATPASIAEAGALLRAGRLVALPTETVYGLAADATNDAAVASVFAAKQRPQFNPLIVHVADLAAAEKLVVFDTASRALAAAFWPGPLTLVLPRRAKAGLSWLVSAGLETVAIRVPRHPVAQAVLAVADRPLAAPSANPSGQLSPTRAEHVRAGLGGQVALILDGGPCALGLESTIVRVTGDRVAILRPGSITPEEVARVSGLPIAFASAPAADRPDAPGQLESHYAPRARVRLNAAVAGAGERLLGFGPAAPEPNLSPAGDLVEAAANLFLMLRDLDETGCDAIAVMPIPDEGLGLAINDRLRRAAAPRPPTAAGAIAE